MHSTHSRSGFQPIERRIYAYNRTGAAVVQGDLGALNLDFASATYDEINGETTDARRNVLAVTTANASRYVVPAITDIPNGSEGWWLMEGEGVVKMNGANAGEFIHATNAQVYATPLTLTELDSVTAPTGLIGIALEASSGVQAKRAIFCGEAWKHLVGGGA